MERPDSGIHPLRATKTAHCRQHPDPRHHRKINAIFILLCRHRPTILSSCAVETGTHPGSLLGTLCFASLAVVQYKAPEVILEFPWKAGDRMTLVLLFTWIICSLTPVLQVQSIIL